jgi:hypothetical protein
VLALSEVAGVVTDTPSDHPVIREIIDADVRLIRAEAQG